MLLKLAWRNIWRNKVRTIITLASVFFAVLLCSVMSAIQSGVYDNMIKNVAGFYSGYIQIHHTGYWNERILDNSFEASANLEARVLQNENVTEAAPRLESFALASSETNTHGCLVVGIDPQKENKVTDLSKRIVDGKYFSSGSTGVLLAEGLARRLALKVGDTIVFLGQGYHGVSAAGKYPIAGIVKFGSPDLNDQMAYLHLKQAQELYGAENLLSSLVLSIKDADKLNEIKSEVQKALNGEYEVMSWEDMMPELVQTIQVDKSGGAITKGILYMIMFFGIFGTVLMMLAERRHEFGILVSIGMKKIKLSQILLLESIFIASLGVIAGILISFPFVYYLAKNPIRLTGKAAEAYVKLGVEPIFPASTDVVIFLNQGFVVLCLALLIGLYPFFKALRINPMVAMKR